MARSTVKNCAAVDTLRSLLEKHGVNPRQVSGAQLAGFVADALSRDKPLLERALLQQACGRGIPERLRPFEHAEPTLAEYTQLVRLLTAVGISARNAEWACQAWMAIFDLSMPGGIEWVTAPSVEVFETRRRIYLEIPGSMPDE